MARAPRRSIFYPPGLLAVLGWPPEKEWRGAAIAEFVDLVRSAGRQVALSTFTLDDEALVEPSSLLDDAGRARLVAVEIEPPPADRVFSDEALTIEPFQFERLAERAP